MLSWPVSFPSSSLADRWTFASPRVSKRPGSSSLKLVAASPFDLFYRTRKKKDNRTTFFDSIIIIIIIISFCK
jgi:hypothetical protein